MNPLRAVGGVGSMDGGRASFGGGGGSWTSVHAAVGGAVDDSGFRS